MKKFNLIFRLIRLVKKFWLIMTLAIINGIIGNLFPIGISFLGAYGLVLLINGNYGIEFIIVISLMIAFGLLRGALRYFEQYSNHFIAFKILAHIRHIIFKKLAELSPSKIDRKDKGALLNQITSDVETLEVFYAHTISPVFIAIFTNGTIVILVSIFLNWIIGLIYLLFYLLIGILIPFKFYNSTKKEGYEYRQDLASFSAFSLDTISGRKDIKLLNKKDKFILDSEKRVNKLNKEKRSMSIKNSNIKSITDFLIYFGAILIIVMSVVAFKVYKLNLNLTIISLVTFISSFGPIIALANLPGNLNQTFASAKRLFNLLDEKPLVKEVNNDKKVNFESLKIENLSFSYDKTKILNNVSFALNSKEIIGIVGESGIGKSTLLKLIMRYYPYEGEIKINEVNINEIDNRSFHENVCMFSQNTYLFNETLKENMLIAKQNATDEEIIEALKKASIYDFVLSLENGLDTVIKEDSTNISLGEKQRLGLARVFLRNPKLLLLDEPTSNIDSFNESMILNSLKKYKGEMTIIMISHKESTMSIADKIYRLRNGKLYA